MLLPVFSSCQVTVRPLSDTAGMSAATSRLPVRLMAPLTLMLSVSSIWLMRSPGIAVGRIVALRPLPLNLPSVILVTSRFVLPAPSDRVIDRLPLLPMKLACPRLIDAGAPPRWASTTPFAAVSLATMVQLPSAVVKMPLSETEFPADRFRLPPGVVCVRVTKVKLSYQPIFPLACRLTVVPALSKAVTSLSSRRVTVPGSA